MVGGAFTLCEECVDALVVTDEKGESVPTSAQGDRLTFETTAGKRYYISGFVARAEKVVPQNAVAKWTEKGVALSWDACAGSYAVYRATGDDKDYTLLGETSENAFVDESYSTANKTRATYKIVAQKPHFSNSCGAIVAVHPATALEYQRYVYKLKQLNLDKEF